MWTELVWLMTDKWRALVNAVMNLSVPKIARKLSKGYTICRVSSSARFHRVSLVSPLVSCVL
jgi:hypothetical protein